MDVHVGVLIHTGLGGATFLWCEEHISVVGMSGMCLCCRGSRKAGSGDAHLGSKVAIEPSHILVDVGGAVGMPTAPGIVMDVAYSVRLHLA